MAKTIITLRGTTPSTRNEAGEVLTFDHVGAIQGGQNNALLTFFNEDPVMEHPETGHPVGGPKPFFAIASSEVLKVETPEFNRPPQEPVSLVIPRGRIS